MAENLNAKGVAAGLNPKEQGKVDSFYKALEEHRKLSNLPSDVANKAFNRKTPAEQTDLIQKFGNEDPAVKPKRGWLGTAWHYTGGALGNAIGYAGSHVLAGLGNISDLSTRAYRTAIIAADQGVDLGKAWNIANDKGDKVFSPGRIEEAKSLFDPVAVDVAMRLASGEKPEKVLATATPEEAKYVRLADPRNTQIAGIRPEDISAERALFQDAMDAVNAAKYSPGRQIANLITPRELEGSGLFYKAVSGAVDAAYRILADPLLIAGKAKRAWDVTHYAVDVVVGGNKVSEVFSQPRVVNFWNQYGEKLNALNKVLGSKEKNVNEIYAIKKDLQTLAPEFGDEVVNALRKAPVPVTDAKTAEAFFLENKQITEMWKGQIGRQRVVIPRMDPLRQARIATVTTGRKVFNLDRIGPKFVDDYWFGGATTADGIAETVINNQKQIIDEVTAKTNFKGIARFSTAYIQYRIDRAKASLTLAPVFDEIFDVTAPDAPEKMYRLATLLMPTKNARKFSEAFGAIEEVGKKKDMYYGLWSTIAEMRGMNTNLPGQSIVRQLINKNPAIHSVASGDDAFREKGALPSDFNNFVATPSIADLDRAAARNGLVQKMLGVVNGNFANKMSSAWSFMTLAGPRYALRNAGEDLMVNLAIGESPWGVIKARQLSTRLNTALSKEIKEKGFEAVAQNPLGIVMRLVNKDEAAKYQAEINGIANSVENARKKVQELEALIKRTKNPAAKQVLKDELDQIKKTASRNIVEETRQVFARALTEGRINRLRKSMGLKPMNQKEADLLSEQIIYGNIEDALNVVSEGGMNYATGNDYIQRSMDLAKQMGVRQDKLSIKYPAGKLVRAKGERTYKVIGVTPDDEASMVTWLMRIGYYANDELGAIAVANMGNTAADDARAIAKMKDWVFNTKAGQKFLKDARLQNDLDAEGIVRLAYNRAKENFYKGDTKDINLDLINKIRTKNKKGEWEITGKLSLDDLPTDPNLVPRAIVGPTLVPAVDTGEITANVMTNGWTWLGLANARMSRQPIVLEEMIKIRRQFKDSGFEAKWIENYTRGIDKTNTTGIAIATERAKRELAMVIQERAVSQTLAYVDNPLVKTNLAFSARNFARFYRATEDFYRRMYRVVRYNPEAIVKAALTYEGVTHSGWIQQDDQGESYFVYPGVAPVYNAVNDALTAMGIKKQFKVPFPVEFGAKLKMTTPSLNPDSLIPTFSGPIAGIGVTALTSLVNIWSPGAADTIKGYALGKYSVDQPILSAFLPAHINRLYGAMNQDDRNSQYASAWRKAVTYLEASGHGLPKRYDDAGNLIPPTAEELESYRLSVKNTTLSILGIRFVFGFFAPASPQVQLKSDMAQWISDNGRANFKQLFNKLLDQYPGDYDAAMAKWVELYPNQIPFTLTESERKSLAPLRYAEEAGNFVDQNKGLFKEFPNAAAFLIPHKTGFSWDAYKVMKDEGLLQNKRVDDYLREVQTAADLQEYYARRNEYQTALANSTVQFERTQIRKEFDAWKEVFFAGRPLVQEELSQASDKAIKRLNTVNELQRMLDQGINIRPNTEKGLREMMKVYQAYREERASLESMGVNRQLVTSIKDDAIAKLKTLAEFNENTKAAYDVLFGPMLEN